MSKFPLYDSLYKEADDKDISSSHRKNFLSKITSLDQDGYELVYVLIKIYYLKHNDDSGIVLPYNGKYVNKTDISFDFISASDVPPSCSISYPVGIFVITNPITF